MSCQDDDKFDSQKLILLRTFNWCATSHDGYYQRRDDQTDGYLAVCSFMCITWHGMAKCVTLGGQLGMIPILSTNRDERIPSSITEGWEGFRFGEARDASTAKHSFVFLQSTRR